jgi:hypothetical protein
LIASAQKCGGVQKKMTPKRRNGVHASELRTAAQPTRTGTAPAAPPMTMFDVEDRLSQSVYTNT